MTSDLETIQRKAASLDKKQRTHDIIVKETKQKEAEAMEAWEKVSVENHDLSKELKRLKRDLDDTCATLDEQKRQNKSFQDENQNLSMFFKTLYLNETHTQFSQTILRLVESSRACREGQAQRLPGARRTRRLSGGGRANGREHGTVIGEDDQRYARC